MNCKTCQYHDKPWPRNIPKPDCRLRQELQECKNPVTIAVINQILQSREERNAEIVCGDSAKPDHLILNRK